MPRNTSVFIYCFVLFMFRRSQLPKLHCSFVVINQPPPLRNRLILSVSEYVPTEFRSAFRLVKELFPPKPCGQY